MARKLVSEELVRQYAASHQNRANQICHLLGIPMIVASIVLAAGGFWRIAIAGFVVGWIFQFVGHAFEGKPPEFFRDWRFLFVGLRWWFAKLRGQA